MTSRSLANAQPRLPAEWEPHASTLLAWPHNADDWPGKLAAIPWVYGEIVRRILPGERVRILVRDTAHERRARSVLARVGALSERVEFLRVATDRSWLRDSGPCFAALAGRSVIVRFRFNAWAKYPDHAKDNRVPERVARLLATPIIPARHAGRDVVLECGAIDGNGDGTLIASEQCLLDPGKQVRNPGFTRKHYEHVFGSFLGTRHVIWLGNGIEGDDTHGHVDDFCRFVGPRTLVLCREQNANDANHRALDENRERLAQARLADGSRPEVVALPMPEPLFFAGRRLPASYANFYIANSTVLVPTFNDPRDGRALNTLQELFPGRAVVGIHAVDLVWGLGTVHCLTREQPATSA
jgi:agmatine deiminase